MEKNIPNEVGKQIELDAQDSWADHPHNNMDDYCDGFVHGAEQYYLLSSKALSDANKEIADLKRQLEKYETNRYDKDEDDYDPDQDRDDPRNNQTFGGRY